MEERWCIVGPSKDVGVERETVVGIVLGVCEFCSFCFVGWLVAALMKFLL